MVYFLETRKIKKVYSLKNFRMQTGKFLKYFCIWTETLGAYFISPNFE